MKINGIERTWKPLKEMPLGEAFKGEDNRYYMKIRQKKVLAGYGCDETTLDLDGTQPIVDIETGDVVWADAEITCYLIEATVEVKV